MACAHDWGKWCPACEDFRPKFSQRDLARAVEEEREAWEKVCNDFDTLPAGEWDEKYGDADNRDEYGAIIRAARARGRGK